MNYRFDENTDRRGTYCTQWDYISDRFGSDDVLPFSISDMDFSLPKDMVDYLKENLTNGVYGYTRWKNEYLLDAIKSWYLRRFNLEIKETNIAYSPTVIFSISMLLDILSNENDKVMTFIPAYDAFFKLIEDNKRTLIKSNMILENKKYVIDKEDFSKKIKSCSIFLLCSPYNPLGKLWDEDELEYIISECKKNNVKIISDEIHMDISFEKKHIPLIKIGRKLNYSNNIIIVTSATKSFNFPGLLFSYLISDNEELINIFIEDLKQKKGLSSCTILGMHATAYVYNNLEGWLEELNDYIYENFKYVKEQLKDYPIKINEFDGTYLLWLDVSHYNIEKLIDIMYKETKVGFMSGEVYGMDNYLRINIGCSKFKLEEGLKRFKKALEILEVK